MREIIAIFEFATGQTLKSMAQNTRKRAASSDAVQMASAEIGNEPESEARIELQRQLFTWVVLDTESICVAPVRQLETGPMC